ncbi:MAG: hypothetical protein A3G49_02155 [Candidatus Sungbacteria bacterium RIFCSPLOWO2_12_FULL_41_11]|uniref:Uncharacterized protein n=1 Tax=Candidatus Sungbacteria bacterium RIFCSPLOWO2_12_FULL_41_11 TaxID=1802286 RepID=A0A1G2LNG3_9BACT|nr:MAG: hypothetical protein A3G49_02155 [Candidatus Sungbacteria bacterium RIFCSPLOWO2_12_FULL_41_11]
MERLTKDSPLDSTKLLYQKVNKKKIREEIPDLQSPNCVSVVSIIIIANLYYLSRVCLSATNFKG